ncbi:zinc-finger domain-containing protein [Ferrovibrio sp.]|uniref:zinc-finger domain-containing protein n=1 Tax=Ferrovibrio sp. TaxID=1917215 RepID=UPI0025BBFEFC|nr:zinc-finger domain-containing protein [Ferrovibrio sp.]MBX3453426.1 zinc-finger domain-containing protein [Ferrovibrio sp.]
MSAAAVSQAPTDAIETVVVKSAVVACDGDGGALGHPRVYLNMGEKHSIDCPYCGRHYVLDEAAAGHHGH